MLGTLMQVMGLSVQACAPDQACLSNASLLADQQDNSEEAINL